MLDIFDDNVDVYWNDEVKNWGWVSERTFILNMNRIKLYLTFAILFIFIAALATLNLSATKVCPELPEGHLFIVPLLVPTTSLVFPLNGN